MAVELQSMPILENEGLHEHHILLLRGILKEQVN